uniref:Uncharacterized protein n=1 Tax=Megaselia scalaris TaxID=36166 RepID=T1GZI1_MEGSC
MWRVNHQSLIPVTRKIDSDSRYMSTEEQNRELTRSIRREVAKLSEQWNNLIDKSDNWKQRLDDFMTVSGKWYTIVIGLPCTAW